jgi:cephalosporin hydroxylase
MPSSSADEQVAQEMVIVSPQGFVGCYIVSFDAVNRGVTGSKMKAGGQNPHPM